MATPEAIRQAVAEVLCDANYRDNTWQLRAEIAAMPTEAYAVQLIEQCVRQPDDVVPT